jgi:uncharacterized membrane protein
MTTAAPTDRARRRAATLDDPQLEHLRDPRSRRRLALAFVGVLVAEGAVLLTMDLVPVVVSSALIGVALLALVLVGGMLKASTRGVEELDADVLDERQQQVQGEVYRRSYTVLSVVALVAVGVLLADLASGWEAPRTVRYTVLALSVQLVLFVPSLVAALHRRP